jgi:hypothetical protein
MANATKRRIVVVEVDEPYDNQFAGLPGNTRVVESYPSPDDVWGEDSTWPRDEWKDAVNNNATTLGYWAWVEHEKDGHRGSGDEWDDSKKE